MSSGDKTSFAPNQLWQTDSPDRKVIGCFLMPRYQCSMTSPAFIVAWKLGRDDEGCLDVTRRARPGAVRRRAPTRRHRCSPATAACFFLGQSAPATSTCPYLATWLDGRGISDISAPPLYPMTQVRSSAGTKRSSAASPSATPAIGSPSKARRRASRRRPRRARPAGSSAPHSASVRSLG